MLAACSTRCHGDDGAFPAPQALRNLDLDLPGRRAEYLHAVAEAALDGRLDGATLRSIDPDEAVRVVQEIKGLGPFSAELVVIRGANAPDALPHHERRLEAEVTERYGPDHTLDEVSEAWRPFRTWAAVHLRTLREQRTHEINRGGPTTYVPLAIHLTYSLHPGARRQDGDGQLMAFNFSPPGEQYCQHFGDHVAVDVILTARRD